MTKSARTSRSILVTRCPRQANPQPKPLMLERQVSCPSWFHRPCRHEQAPGCRQVIPGASGSGGAEVRRACSAVSVPGRRPVPDITHQELLARAACPAAGQHHIARAADRLFMDLPSACGRPYALALLPVLGQISLSPAHPRSESRFQMEGFQAEGGLGPRSW